MGKIKIKPNSNLGFICFLLCNLGKTIYSLKVFIVQTIKWERGGIIYVFLMIILIVKYSQIFSGSSRMPGTQNTAKFTIVPSLFYFYSV